MSRVKQIAMAAGTFSVALGIGFVMQNGDVLASRFGADPVEAESTPIAPDVAPVGQAATVEPVAPTPQEPQASEPAEVLTEATFSAGPTAPEDGPSLAAPQGAPADLAAAVSLPQAARPPEPAAPPVELAAVESDDSPAVPLAETQPEPQTAQSCDIGMDGAAVEAAMVALEVTAPCHAGSPFVLHHQGMMFSARTDDQGSAMVEVPALAEVAVFIAAFPDGEGSVSTVTVPDFADYDRAVLQWQGETGVMLSAYEFGAGYGDTGHISRENVADVDRAIAGDGGFLVQLGDTSVDEPLLAEVYTFPSEQHDNGAIQLIAEAEITQGNCGQDIAAQSIQVFPDGNTLALDMAVRMPDCDAVGDYLFLQNMFEDLKLASR
ncbi:MAG: hypothetical protein GVY31_12170 [Alphaproteobacteria bacterium]|jgi:hypothetical protein|nr:hypothetical protein [Alphaproteobacteria bacterium]